MSRVVLSVGLLALTCVTARAEVFFSYDGKVLARDELGHMPRPRFPLASPQRAHPHEPRSRTASTKPGTAPASAPAAETRPARTAALQVPHLSDTPSPGDQPPSVVDGGARPAIEPEVPELVTLKARQLAGSIIIDSGSRRLYFFISGTVAYRYPISVGREGFRWTGTEKVSGKRSWPDWHPPPEMRERDPRLPEVMTGGIRNPLGARAIYLGDTLYRIHGTNNVATIGTAASSGCFRMRNEHVTHLSRWVRVGTKVTVVDHLPPEVESGIEVKAEPGSTGQRARHLTF